MTIRSAPKQFRMEESTIWSFPDRGKWATHSGKYRGNWSPYVPRNLILRYSKENDWILDQFAGSGTTLIEAKLLNRNAIGIDINPKSVSLSEHNLEFQSPFNPRIYVRQGTARNLAFIKDNSIDPVCTHPPYADIIKYSENSGILGKPTKNIYLLAHEYIFALIKEKKFAPAEFGVAFSANTSYSR